MKKVLCILVVYVMMFALAACTAYFLIQYKCPICGFGHALNEKNYEYSMIEGENP